MNPFPADIFRCFEKIIQKHRKNFKNKFGRKKIALTFAVRNFLTDKAI